MFSILLLASAAAAGPTIPQMKAKLYRDCLTKAPLGAPPDMRHLIPDVCTCFVERLTAGRSRDAVRQAMDRDQGPLGRQCITEAAQRDRARRR